MSAKREADPVLPAQWFVLLRWDETEQRWFHIASGEDDEFGHVCEEEIVAVYELRKAAL